MTKLTNEKHLAYNKEGEDLCLRIKVALSDIIDRVRVGNMNPFEAEAITHHAVMVIFAEHRLTQRGELI